jgi:hypothetical protein
LEILCDHCAVELHNDAGLHVQHQRQQCRVTLAHFKLCC